MGFVDDFAEKIYSQFKVYVAVPPLQTVRPGDYGKLDGRVWHRDGTLASLPQTLPKQPATTVFSHGGDIEWKTEGTVANRFKTGAHLANGPVAGHAGFDISFKSQNEAYFWMPGAKYIEMTNLGEIMDELVRRSQLEVHDPKHWDTDYCVVSAVYVTPNLTEVIARGDKSDIRIEADAEPKDVNLVDADLSFHVTSTDSSSLHYISKLDDQDMEDVGKYYTVFLELVQVHYFILTGAHWWSQP